MERSGSLKQVYASSTINDNSKKSMKTANEMPEKWLTEVGHQGKCSPIGWEQFDGRYPSELNNENCSIVRVYKDRIKE